MFDASFADFDAELSEHSSKPVTWVIQTTTPVDRQTLKEQRRCVPYFSCLCQAACMR